MSDRIDARAFRDAEGVGDWRVVDGAACSVFRTRSFVRGVELIGRIAELAEEANHHPDVDLRYGSVTVRLVTHEAGGLTERDLALARRISEAARTLGVEADPGRVQEVGLEIRARTPATAAPFWQAVLAYRPSGDDGDAEVLADPRARLPRVRIRPGDDPVAGGLRIVVSVPDDAADERVRAALEAGGRLVGEVGPGRWLLADPQQHEVEVRAERAP
ncbi:MAG: hypothetical protein KatS3mg013_1265 [Actinomycetota bacterium]|nr:MAG: hypothetical protein KatS3mg013_1265 [Actinomycetota bacterium]